MNEKLNPFKIPTYNISYFNAFQTFLYKPSQAKNSQKFGKMRFAVLVATIYPGTNIYVMDLLFVLGRTTSVPKSTLRWIRSETPIWKLALSQSCSPRIKAGGNMSIFALSNEKVFLPSNKNMGLCLYMNCRV